MPLERRNYIKGLVLIGLTFVLSSSLVAQNFKTFPSKNDEGKYGILSRNLETNITDTLAPFIYHNVSLIGDNFLLVDKRMDELNEKGQLGEVYYSGDLVTREMKFLKHFDSIHGFNLNSANVNQFKFCQNGKRGFYSTVFLKENYTQLYDEITPVAEVKVAGVKYKQPSFIARLGGNYTLIGPYGDSLMTLGAKDEVKAWGGRLLRIDYFDTKSFDLMDVAGSIVASNVTSYESSYDGSMTIFSHPNGLQSLWYANEQLVAPAPYVFSRSASRNSDFLVVEGADGLFYMLNSQGTIKSGPFEGLIKLNRTNHLLIKEEGLWRIEGKDVKKYTDGRYMDLEELSRTGRKASYILQMGETKLAILVQGDFIRIGETIADLTFVEGEIFAEKDKKWGYLTFNGFSDFTFDRIVASSNWSDYLIGRIGKFEVLLHRDGTMLFQELKLKEIESHDCEMGECFELKNKTGTGYFQFGMDPKKINLIYDDFECGDYGFCLKKNGKWGLLNTEGEILEKFIHKKLKEVQFLELH